MQLSFLRKRVCVVAPDPTRRNALISFVYIGVAIVALLFGLAHLPGPISNLLAWQTSPLPPDLQMIFSMVSWIAPGLINLSFFPYTYQCLSRHWAWKELEPSRQQAATELLQGFLPVLFPLPTVVESPPTTISIRTSRNWRATCIAAVFLILLWELWLVPFIYRWPLNIQPLVQQGQTDLILLKIVINVAIFSFPALPAFLAMILVPRQQILADEDGLYCYLGLRAAYIPWHEARLFSVIAEEMGILVYELASDISIIRWSHTLMKDNFPYATFGSSPLKIVESDPSEEEYRWSIRLLTVLIAEKTGLPLIDLRQLSDDQLLISAANHMP